MESIEMQEARGRDIKRVIAAAAIAAAEVTLIVTGHHNTAADLIAFVGVGQASPPLERMMYGNFPWIEQN